MEHSTNNRESNPELSSHRSQSKTFEFNFHSNESDIETMAVNDIQQQQRIHTFRNSFKNNATDTSTPYPIDFNNPQNIPTTKREDRTSGDSNYFSPSLQESHDSRKSLTKL